MVAVCPVTPIFPRTLSACVAMSKPATWAWPPSGSSRVVRIRTIVVFPAPLRPSSAQTLPADTSKLTSTSACVSPKERARCCAEIAKVVIDSSVVSESAQALAAYAIAPILRRTQAGAAHTTSKSLLAIPARPSGEVSRSARC